jgi:glycosyltransferase involved in cell wall biosynthesis
MQPSEIVVLFAGRFPSEKAAGLFVDLNARSLAHAGAHVTVLAPRRLGRGSVSQTPYGIVYVPTLDMTSVPLIASLAHYLSTFVFSFSALIWILFRAPNATIISNDAFPLLIVSLFKQRTLYEMHDFADRSLWMYRILFRRVTWILATNEWKKNKLIEMFGVPLEKIVLERNGVDVELFGSKTKAEARSLLQLDPKDRIVLYTGHLYDWKGADTLAAAAASLAEATVIFVGGTENDTERFRAKWSHEPNIRIVGHVPHALIPLWQSAADVLVLPNSSKEEISVHYTSPMKLFEYMASNRPIVASDLPSIREVLPETACIYATPDDAASFADAVKVALSDSDRARVARGLVAEYSWEKRARRILARMTQ